MRLQTAAMTPDGAYSASSHSAHPIRDLTVVVPSYNERDNVEPLIDRLEQVCPELQLDVLFVDDSSDGTDRIVIDRAALSSRTVNVIHRRPAERIGGLGGAVQAGLRTARAEWVCVMDADLQHPPEVITSLVAAARRSDADVVVASRYCPTGNVGPLTPARKAVSRGSSLLARALFPGRLQGVSDPMSGFFLVRRAAVDPEALRPCGFKILLEILLSGPRLRVSEVPFCFGHRHAGESKASFLEGRRYLRRLIELRLRRERPVARTITAPRPAESTALSSEGVVISP